MNTETKFFVINVKRFEELNHNTRAKGCNCRSVGECYCDMFGLELADEVEEFKNAYEKFIKAYEERVGKFPDNKYWVVNQDEPYADEIFKLIEKGEDFK